MRLGRLVREQSQFVGAKITQNLGSARNFFDVVLGDGRFPTPQTSTTGHTDTAVSSKIHTQHGRLHLSQLFCQLQRVMIEVGTNSDFMGNECV